MRIDAGEVSLEVDVSGPDDGPPVLLLHGFPDTRRMWRNQIVALNDAGFRTVAPDLRGAGGSDKPEGVDRYNVLSIVGDAVGVLDHLGIGRAHVVGHDWGSAFTWAMASFLPDRVDHVVALSVGHPRSFSDVGIKQRQLSWYMLFFQFEGIAEEWLAMDDFANFRAWGSHPDIEDVISRMSEPGALTPMLNWYRANVHPRTWVQPPLELPLIAAPTMGIWSSGDFALAEEGMTGSARHVSGPFRYERVEGAGHWMTIEAPDRVNELLLDFLPSPR